MAPGFFYRWFSATPALGVYSSGANRPTLISRWSVDSSIPPGERVVE